MVSRMDTRTKRTNNHDPKVKRDSGHGESDESEGDRGVDE